MRDLETLQTITALGLFPNYVQHGIHKLSAFRIMSLGPVVSGATLSKDKVVGAEELSKLSTADSIHRSRLKINQDCSRHIFVIRGLIKVDIDAVDLLFPVTVVRAVRIDGVLL